jgi:transcriptional regulator of acetoin/glycerol metabolism
MFPGAASPSSQESAGSGKLTITAVLHKTGGNIRQSATVLGIDRSTLHEKFKKYEILR